MEVEKRGCGKVPRANDSVRISSNDASTDRELAIADESVSDRIDRLGGNYISQSVLFGPFRIDLTVPFWLT